MTHALLSQLEYEQMQENSKIHESFLQLRVGDRVRLSFGKGKKQHFLGICLAIRRRGASSSFVLRNSLSGEGLEARFFPYSSSFDLEVLPAKQPLSRFRRAKLYFLRDRSPKEYTVSA